MDKLTGLSYRQEKTAHFTLMETYSSGATTRRCQASTSYLGKHWAALANLKTNCKLSTMAHGSTPIHSTPIPPSAGTSWESLMQALQIRQYK